MDSHNPAVAVEASVDVDVWREQFDTVFARIAGRFGRVEPRLQARSFLLGLLSDVDTRSCWQLAEQAGDASPHAMQRLLGEAVWTPTRSATISAATYRTSWASPTAS